MCDPVTIGLVGFGISALGSVAEFSAASQQASDARALQDAQIAVNQEQQRQTIEAALVNFNNQQAQLDLRASEEREAAGQNAFETRLASLRASADAAVSSGETAGLSVDALLADFAGAGGRGLQAIDTNLNNRLGQINVDRDASRAQAQSIVNSASVPQIRRTINSPSPFALGLNIAGAGLGAFNDFQKTRPRPTGSGASARQTSIIKNPASGRLIGRV